MPNHTCCSSPLYNAVKTFFKPKFLVCFLWNFWSFFPSCSSNGQSRCRSLPKHWSPVIIIWRQPVLMLGRPWEKSFFIHEKENRQSGVVNRACLDIEAEKARVKAEETVRTERTHLLFLCVIKRFRCQRMFVTHVIIRVSSPGSLSTPSTNRGELVKLYLFHCRPSSKLNLGTQTAVTQGAAANPPTVCAS